MTEPDDDSAVWLAAARAGSRDALGKALEPCRRYLLLVAERNLDPVLRSKGGASDLVQETFLEAHRQFGRFHGTSQDELLAWLRRMLLFNVGDFSRRYLATSKRGVGREMTLEGEGSRVGIAGILAGSTLSPSGIAMEHEQAYALARALERLPEDYRQVVILRYQDGLTFEEIGRRIERSAEAARKVWSRAMERLRDEWEGLT
jgi:RNA polymerase sigma-70 factor (ECF subfamily)